MTYPRPHGGQQCDAASDNSGVTPDPAYTLAHLITCREERHQSSRMAGEFKPLAGSLKLQTLFFQRQLDCGQGRQSPDFNAASSWRNSARLAAKSCDGCRASRIAVKPATAAATRNNALKIPNASRRWLSQSRTVMKTARKTKPATPKRTAATPQNTSPARRPTSSRASTRNSSRRVRARATPVVAKPRSEENKPPAWVNVAQSTAR